MVTEVNEGLLNPIPPGLLASLGLKTRGINPDTLSRIAALSIEARDWYFLAGDIVTETQSGSPLDNTGAFYAGYSGGVPINVRSGEIWWIWDYTAIIRDLSAASVAINVQQMSAVWFHVNITNSALKVGHPVGPITSAAPGASAFHINAPSLSNFWAVAGSTPGLYWQGSWTGGAPEVQARVRYTRLPL